MLPYFFALGHRNDSYLAAEPPKLYGSFGMEIPCEPLENRLSNMGKKKSPREMLTRVTNQRISLKGLILQEKD